MKFFWYLIATGLGTGFSPIAPGTAGSLLALILFYLFWPINVYLFLLILAVLFGLGVIAGTKLETVKGKDPSIVVIDEVVGMGISLLFLDRDWILFLIAFFLFRLFDIIKPPPARNLENLKGGLGIMIDDVVAGIYALVCTQLIAGLFF